MLIVSYLSISLIGAVAGYYVRTQTNEADWELTAMFFVAIFATGFIFLLGLSDSLFQHLSNAEALRQAMLGAVVGSAVLKAPGRERERESPPDEEKGEIPDTGTDKEEGGNEGEEATRPERSAPDATPTEQSTDTERTTNFMQKRTLVTGGVILALLFALLVWPTAYRYYTIDRGDHECLVQMNRVTGETLYFCGDRPELGWEEPEE
jgi:hypothetical protein